MKKFVAVLCVSLCVLWLSCCFSAEPVKEKGLVAYWSFDEGKGDKAKDLSGNGQDVETGGAEWTKGKIGGALLFNGVDAILSIENSDKLILVKALSIEAWVKHNDLEGFQEIFNDNQFFLRKDGPGEGNKYSLFVKLGDGSVEPRAAGKDVVAEVDKWCFVAATWDGSIAKIYINGALIGQSAREGELTGEIVTATIGGGEQTSTSSNYFNGIIDELKIYNRVLTDAEIKSHFQAVK